MSSTQRLHSDDGIVTPEAVVLRFSEAGIGSRTLAFTLDVLVQLGIAIGFFLILAAGLRTSVSDSVAIISVAIFAFLILFAYPVIQETFWNGRTVGKAAVGLRAVTVEGAPVRFRHAAIRAALGIFEFWATAGGAALLSCLFTRRSQRLGDLAAGTMVVRARSGQQASRAFSFQPFAGWEGFAAALDTSRLRSDQYALIRSFLTRAAKLDTQARWALAEQLSDATCRQLGISFPAGQHHEAFLVAVVAAYQQRSGLQPAPARAAPARLHAVAAPHGLAHSGAVVMLGYLDHAATTPVRPEARDSMLPWLGELVGNPSGAHRLARNARRAIDDARDVFAAVTGFGPGDIVFTSGGTEADNLAITGTLARSGGIAVTVSTEHHAVLHPVEAAGGRVVGVDRCGRIDLDELAANLDERIRIVSVMLVNNETGVINDVAAIVDLVRERAPEAIIHTDAVQSVPWLDVASATAGVDLLSLSAHKFGGPQGVGILAFGPGVTVRPQLLGGGQERDRRSGTQNVAGIVGAAAAAAATVEARPVSADAVRLLRDRLVDGILDQVDGAVETGIEQRERRGKIAGNAHICFPGTEAEALLVLLENAGVYASAGSSCASGAQEPSHVLTAMGVPHDHAVGSLRLSLGWTSTDADVDLALAAVPAAVDRLRAFA